MIHAYGRPGELGSKSTKVLLRFKPACRLPIVAYGPSLLDRVHQPVREPSPNNVLTPGPRSQCWKHQHTCCASAASTEIDPQTDLHRTEQAPKKPCSVLCSICIGQHRPAGSLPAPAPVGPGLFPGLCLALGVRIAPYVPGIWGEGVECAVLHTFTMCAAPPPGAPGSNTDGRYVNPLVAS